LAQFQESKIAYFKQAICRAGRNNQGQRTNFDGNWTSRLLRAAVNYQYTQKDPGAFVYNPKYVIQFLIDSIEDRGGDVSIYTCPEIPVPAQ
jgi:hypothetical protein